MKNQCNTDNLDKWIGVIIVKSQVEILTEYRESIQDRMDFAAYDDYDTISWCCDEISRINNELDELK